MPTTRLPPTPASSTEIVAMDKPGLPPAGELFFALPPAAIPASKDHPSATPYSSGRSIHPLSPTSPELLPHPQPSQAQSKPRASRQRSSTKRSAQEFDLPPPPTRTRKIIQMKPKAQDQQRPSTAKSRNGNNQTDSAVNAVAAESAASAATAASPPAKKQKTGTTTAAGRKIARKTAHSLIERRRRSKMNEEFATLKDMIPACKGQDMHKLAILQASIEYMNYLEQCVTELKVANRRRGSSPDVPNWAGPSAEGDHSDAYLSSTPEQSPAQHASSPRGHQLYNQSSPLDPSPRLPPFEVAPMTLPSPLIEMSKSQMAAATPVEPSGRTLPSFAQSTGSFMLTSPAMLPQSQRDSVPPTPLSHGADADPDREASNALLMLNSVSRRQSSSTTEPPTRKKLGISVHDLIH